MNRKLEALVASGQNYDGDTVYDGEQGYRLTNIDTPEMTNVNGENSRQAFIELVQGGGQLTPTGEYDKYGRELTDFTDANGESLSRVMAQGGLAGPTSFADESHQFAPLAGNLRQALGMSRTENDIVNKYAERRKVDSSLLRNVLTNRKGYSDNRSTFGKSIDRGQAELKMGLGGAINYLGDRFDSDIMRDYGREMFVEAELDSALAGREIETFDEIENLSDAMTYGMETVGEALPGFALDAGMALATGGASLAATAARRGGIKALSRAGAYGAGLSAGVQSGGAMEAQLEMQGSEDNPFAPIFQGGVSAGMTALPVGAVLDRVLGKFADESVKRKVGESVISAFKTAGVAAAVEAPTSAVESFSNQVIESIALGKDTEVDYQLMVDDMLRGAFGGMVMGGGMDAVSTGIDHAYAVASERANFDADNNRVDDKNNMLDPDGNTVPVSENTDPVKNRVYKDRQAADRSVSGGSFASEASHDLRNLGTEDFSWINEIVTGDANGMEMGAELRPPSAIEWEIENPESDLTEDALVHFLADFRHDGAFALDSQYNYRKEFAILDNEVKKEVMDKLAEDNKGEEAKEVRELFQKMQRAIEKEKNDEGASTAEYKELAQEFKARADKILGTKVMTDERTAKAKDYNWRQAYSEAYVNQENKNRSEGKFRPAPDKNEDGSIKLDDNGKATFHEPFLAKRARERAAEEAQKPKQPEQPTSAREELNLFTESLKQNEDVKQAVAKVNAKQRLNAQERELLGQVQKRVEALQHAAKEEERIAEAMKAEGQESAEPEQESLSDIEAVRTYVSELETQGNGRRYSELHNALDMYEASQRLLKGLREATSAAARERQEGDIKPETLERLDRANGLVDRLMETWGAKNPEMLDDKLLAYIEHVAVQSDIDINKAVTAVSGEALARDAFGEQTSDEDAAINADYEDTEEATQAGDVETREADPDNAYDTRVASDFNSLEMLEGLGLNLTPELRDRVAEPDKAEAKAGAVKNADIQASIGDTFYTTDKETAQREQRSLTVTGQAEGPNRTTTGGKTSSTPKKIRHIAPALIDAINKKIADGDTQGATNLLRKNGLIKQPGTERQSRIARIIRKSRSNLHKYQSAREEINETSKKRNKAANEKRAEEAKKKGETSEDKKAWQDSRVDAGVDMTVPVENGDGSVSMEKVELDGWEITKLGAQAEGIDIENTRWDGDSPDDYLEQLERAFLAGLQMIAGEGVNYGGVDYFGEADVSAIREQAAIGRIEGMDVTTWGDIKRRKFSQARSTRATDKTKYRVIPAKGKTNPLIQSGKYKGKAVGSRALRRLFSRAWEEATSGKGKTTKPFELHPDDWKAIKDLAYKVEAIRKHNGVELFADADEAFDAMQQGLHELDLREYLPDQINEESNVQGELYQGAESSLVGEAEVQEAEGFAADKRTRLTKALGKQEKKKPKQATERKDGNGSFHDKKSTTPKQRLENRRAELEAEKLRVLEANRDVISDPDATPNSSKEPLPDNLQLQIAAIDRELARIQERKGDSSKAKPTIENSPMETPEGQTQGSKARSRYRDPAALEHIKAQLEALDVEIKRVDAELAAASTVAEESKKAPTSDSTPKLKAEAEVTIARNELKKAVNKLRAWRRTSNQRALDASKERARRQRVDIELKEAVSGQSWGGEWDNKSPFPEKLTKSKTLDSLKDALKRARRSKSKGKAERIAKLERSIEQVKQWNRQLNNAEFENAVHRHMVEEYGRTPTDSAKPSFIETEGMSKDDYPTINQGNITPALTPEQEKLRADQRSAETQPHTRTVPNEGKATNRVNLTDEQKANASKIPENKNGQADDDAFNQRVELTEADLEAKVRAARKELSAKLRAKRSAETGKPIREDGSHRPVDAERTEADPELGDGDNLSQAERIRRERAIVKATNRKGHARKALFRFLHTLNSRINRIHPEMGEAVGKFLREKEVRVNRAVTKLNSLFPNKRRGAQQLQKGYRDLQNGKDSVEAEKLQKFVDEIEAELKELDPSYEPTGKVPTVIDFAKVANNQASFMAILREAGVENPEQFAEDILETRGIADMHYSPTGNPTKRSNDELLPAIDKLREAGFVIEDAPTIMTRYSFAAMTRGTWAEANGGYDENGNFRPNGQMTQWMKEVHPANREELNNLLLGATGRLNLHHSRFVRALNSVGMAFQTMTVLLFSGIASIPELGVMYSRARELNGLGADVRKMLSKQGRKEMYQFAADYGIAVDQTIKHTLSSLYSMDELTFGRWNEKVADTVFKLNGQAALTHMNRVMAAEIGKRMLADHARKARGGNRRSERMLAELGIEAETVHHHLMNPDPNTPQGKEFGMAIGRFVNDSVTNPHAGQLPLIASDPRFILLTSLKKFFYGFYNNVHKSLFNEYKNRKAEGSNTADALRPAIMTAALMLPLAAFAEMIRELVKDPTNEKSQSWSEWAKKSALATGGLGPFQAAQSAYDATGYGRNFLVGLAGPTADFILHDVVTGDFMTKRPSRLMPGINQLPWARKPVNEAWRETYEDIFMDGEY